jgi:hypothetical protein
MTRKRWWIVLGVAMVALTLDGLIFEPAIQHSGGPGILGFEFAATKARAD